MKIPILPSPPPSKMKNLPILTKKFWTTEIELFPTFPKIIQVFGESSRFGSEKLVSSKRTTKEKFENFKSQILT